MRLIDHPSWRAYERSARKAFRDWDRATAYGSAQRGVPFDAGRCARLWQEYLAIRATFPVVAQRLALALD